MYYPNISKEYDKTTKRNIAMFFIEYLHLSPINKLFGNKKLIHSGIKNYRDSDGNNLMMYLIMHTVEEIPL